MFYHNCLLFVWNKDLFTYSFDYVYEKSVTCDLLICLKFEYRMKEMKNCKHHGEFAW
jgi:hypothetical protein